MTRIRCLVLSVFFAANLAIDLLPPFPRPVQAAGPRRTTETSLFKADPRKEDFLRYISLSDDRRHAGYVQVRSKTVGVDRWCAVVDGAPGGDYDLIGVNSIVFSSDGTHHAYIAREANEFFVVADAKRGSGYDQIGSFEVAAGSHWISRNWALSTVAAATGPPWMSRDGKHLAYVAHEVKEHPKSFVVLDGVEGAKFDRILDLALSLDGEKSAYVGCDERGCVVVLDRQEHGPYQWAGNLAFSPDGKRFSYAARRDSTLGVYVDGIPKWTTADTVSSVKFSENNSRYGYSERWGDSVSVVVDGARVGSYSDAAAIRFSPDGSHFAFTAAKESQAFVVRDGVKLKSYRLAQDPVFSADGRHLAYSASTGRGVVVVTDSTECCEHQDILSLSYSPDGNHVVYTAVEGGRFSVCIDSDPGHAYDWVFINKPGGSFVFDAAGRFHYLALKKSSVVLVEELLQ